MNDATPSEAQAGTEPESEQTTEQAAWWLTTRRRRPEWQSLMAAGQATFSGRPRAHFEAAQRGDPVFLYVSKPEHAIRALGVITDRWTQETDLEENNDPRSKIQNPNSPDPWIEVQLAFEVPQPLLWRDILAVPALAEAEPVKQRSSATLSRMRQDEYATLRALIISRNPEMAGAFSAVESGSLPEASEAQADRNAVTEAAGGAQEVPQPLIREQPSGYSTPPGESASIPAVRNLAELQALTGLPFEMLEEARDLLEDTGQIVLYGPPGTGKTWLARGLASLVAGRHPGDDDINRVQIVQFHPSTTYEDFIEGLKPQIDAWGRVTYAVIPGIFLRICEQARRDPDHHYVLLIDEINRAPLSRVFGELLYALEYRGPEGAVQLAASAGVGERELFYVPENLLLIGTMNSADRSLALVDYALRRRFRFIELEPNPDVLDHWLAERGNSPTTRKTSLDLFAEVNERLAEALDPDHRLGHTYFMLDPFTPASLDRLWRTAIRPLIAEYFLTPTSELDEYASLFAQAVKELGG